MKIIAIPARKGKVCDHLLQCDYFVIETIENGKISKEEKFDLPEQCINNENIALMLAEKGVEMVLAGKIGYNETDVLYKHNIEVLCFCNGEIHEAVSMFLKGML